GQRRTKLRIPVQSAVDLFEPVTAVFYRIIGAKQSAGNILGLIQEVSATDSVVPNSELATHPLDHKVQIVARCKMRQELSVLLASRIPIDPVHVRRIEVIPIDAPSLVEYLRPLSAWIYAYLYLIDVDLALTRLRFWSHRNDRPHVVAGVK